MELWIRSQNKFNLVNVKSIFVLNNSIRGYYNGNPNWFLGKYETEERALEVLDEIQRFITKLDIEGNRYYQYDVYEMPEE